MIIVDKINIIQQEDKFFLACHFDNEVCAIEISFLLAQIIYWCMERQDNFILKDAMSQFNIDHRRCVIQDFEKATLEIDNQYHEGMIEEILPLAICMGAELYVNDAFRYDYSIMGDVQQMIFEARVTYNKIQIEELNRRLNIAVANEEYELAAQIRDTIKKLEEEIQN